MSYGKHFASTYTGSMVGAGLAVFAVWGYVIANTRKDSTVELNSKMLAGLLGCSQAEVDAAVEFLCNPDTDSRSPGHDGRRLLPIGAFLYEVPNHTQYSTLRNDEERREYLRIKKRESRERQKASTDVSTGQPVVSTVSTHVDVDVDVDVDVNQNPVSEPNGSSTHQETIIPDQQKIKPPVDSSSSVRGTRLPDDWALPDEWLAWAGDAFPSWGVRRIMSVAERFRDYWHGVPGQKGRKSNWEATWRNWCRRDAEQGTGPNAGRDATGEAAIREFVDRGTTPGEGGLLPPPAIKGTT